MKIFLFRFEKEKIHFLECDINSGDLVTGEKGQTPLESAENMGEKYNKIMDELLHFLKIDSDGIFVYQAAGANMRGVIEKNRFANEAMLNLFCYQQSIQLITLTKPIVRKKLNIKNAEFKDLLEEGKKEVMKKYSIARTDKLLEGLTLLFLLRNSI